MSSGDLSSLQLLKIVGYKMVQKVAFKTLNNIQNQYKKMMRTEFGWFGSLLFPE